MSVRGTSHAQVERKVVNHDRGGTFVMCCWDTCDRDGYQLYNVRTHEHVPQIGCESALSKHTTFIFCSERHKQYWVASSGSNAHELAARYNGRQYGMLPPGMRQTIQ